MEGGDRDAGSHRASESVVRGGCRRRAATPRARAPCGRQPGDGNPVDWAAVYTLRVAGPVSHPEDGPLLGAIGARLVHVRRLDADDPAAVGALVARCRALPALRAVRLGDEAARPGDEAAAAAFARALSAQTRLEELRLGAATGWLLRGVARVQASEGRLLSLPASLRSLSVRVTGGAHDACRREDVILLWVALVGVHPNRLTRLQLEAPNADVRGSAVWVPPAPAMASALAPGDGGAVVLTVGLAGTSAPTLPEQMHQLAVALHPVRDRLHVRFTRLPAGVAPAVAVAPWLAALRPGRPRVDAAGMLEGMTASVATMDADRFPVARARSTKGSHMKMRPGRLRDIHTWGLPSSRVTGGGCRENGNIPTTLCSQRATGWTPSSGVVV